MPLRTASHKRRRDAGIPDLEFDVRRKLSVFYLFLYIYLVLFFYFN